jgi:hypothetical protein
MIDFNDAAQQSVSRGNGTERARYVPTDAIHQAVKGREAEVVRALGIPLHGRDHICCPYPNHLDKNPSWRLMESGAAVCSCAPPHSVFDVVMRLEGGDFERAKIRIAELIGRDDLIVESEKPKGLTLEEYAAAKRLPLDWLRKIGVRQTPYGQIPAAVRTPYSRPDGEPSMRFRVALAGKKQHFWRHKDKACLYGARDAASLRDAGYVVLCEGESDTQTLWLHGIPALGLPGAGTWNEARDAHLLDGVPAIFVVIEPDDGGKAALKWLARSAIAPRARLVRMPKETKDPSALYLADPDAFPAAFRAMLGAAEPFPAEMIALPKRNDGAALSIPTIIVERGRMHEAADQGLAALQAARVPFFTRNFELVRVCTVKAKAWDGEIIQVPGILSVKYPALRRAMSQSAYWARPGKKNLCPVDVPKDIVEQVGSMVDEWPFPPLTGLISAPTMRPDGTVLATEGYDEKTGLFLTGLPDMPAIPDHPTRQDATNALTLLLDLLKEFPFANNESRSVGLSCLITPIVRGATGPVPMHLIVKPKPGTGGSYLVDIASVIATGERCPVVAMGDPKHPDEMEKRLISSALLGSPIIGIDNCRGTLEGDFLCQVTERPVMRLRPLGTSDSKTVPNSFTVFANGNNPSIADDMVRRTIRSSMDANMEHPEDREFRADPLAAVRQDRGRYIAAALTIVRAYLAAGKPDRRRPLPSYGGWSDLVRSALVWLKQGDPVATMQDTRAEDPKAEARTAIFEAWKEEIGLGDDNKKQTADLVELAEKGQGTTLVCPRLNAALLKVAGVKGRIDATRLGYWLRDNANSVVLDCKLTVDRSDKARPKWVISDLSRPS